MGIDGLEKSEDNPHIYSDDMEVLSEVAVQEWAEDGSCTQNEDLGRVGVLSSKSEGRRVLVVNLVDMLV